MARGSSQARGAATAAQNISDTAAGNAGSLYGTLAPQLMTEAVNPSGFSPTDMANITTAATQGAGGSMAGATGQGGLLASRTRNAGGSAAAISKSARDTGEELSRGILGAQIQNAQLKNANRRAATAELGQLYGTNMGAATGALGEVANNVNADVNAKNASWNWAKYILDPALQAAGGSKWVAG